MPRRKSENINITTTEQPAMTPKEKADFYRNQYVANKPSNPESWTGRDKEFSVYLDKLLSKKTSTEEGKKDISNTPQEPSSPTEELSHSDEENTGLLVKLKRKNDTIQQTEKEEKQATSLAATQRKKATLKKKTVKQKQSYQEIVQKGIDDDTTLNHNDILHADHANPFNLRNKKQKIVRSGIDK